MKRAFLVLALLVLLTAAASACSPLDLLPGGEQPGGVRKVDGVKILPAATAQMRYETFDNGLVSLEIPEGWKVEAPSVGYVSYTFKAYDPKDAGRMLLFTLKFTGFMKSEAARATFASLYPASLYGRLAAVDPQTTEAFYLVWSSNARIANEEQLHSDYFPCLDGFKVVEDLGKIPLGGDVLRGTYTDGQGRKMQGLFTASLFSAGSYFMYGQDLAPLDSYHNVMMTAPDDEFNNWQPVLDHCLGTVQFSEEFIRGYNREEQSTVSAVRANQKIYDEISDMIMDSWAKRSASYDVISQKQSDATLGYERVYDTETGEVYRAYNGFTDEYHGARYQSVTDDMYTAPVAGTIEK
ncbi:MAG: hypothetical protein II776_04585 [Clostridia bacterium]|nr:hypothetical protein [Clostridia bacterium]